MNDAEYKSYALLLFSVTKATHFFLVMGSDLSVNFSSEAQNKINLFG